MAQLLRGSWLVLVTFVAGAAVWGFASAPSAAVDDVAMTRARTVARSLSLAEAPLQVRVVIDGLEIDALAKPGDDVRSLFAGLGVLVTPADLLSVPPETAVLGGMRIVLDRGFPVTVIDGGQATELRSHPGTAGSLVAKLGLALGPSDRIEPAADTALAAHAVIRIVRVSDREVREIGAVAFPVRYVNDASLGWGLQVVETAGIPGEASRTFAIRYADGQEIERTLLAETQIRQPTTEVRRVGTKVSAAPGDIEGIIREAAARWGASADQLLRVAWCESRYNIYARNASGASGLFQFMPATFARNAPLAGYSSDSIWDPVAQSNTAARMFVNGQAGQWACK